MELGDYCWEEMYEIVRGMGKAKELMVDAAINEQMVEVFDCKEISGGNDGGKGGVVGKMVEDGMGKEGVGVKKERGGGDYKVLRG
ncbi:hypothetical protein, partial [Cytobacillus oceanisediminis]|uniref:hypothetical protein n=1 Tax=Cytobacillus oceanisediminis TaxID=665099 RepID=UPI0011A2D150